MLKLSFWFIQLHHCTFHIITIISWTILQCWTMGFFQIQWRNAVVETICLRICRSMQFRTFSMLTCIHSQFSISYPAAIPVRSSSLSNSQSVVSDWKMKFQPIDSFFFCVCVLQCNFKKENSPRRTEKMEALLLLLILGSVSLRKGGEWMKGPFLVKKLSRDKNRTFLKNGGPCFYCH